MNSPKSLPLAASRILSLGGLILTVAAAALLFTVAAVLALAWPTVISEALEKGFEAKTLGLQPWLSLILAGGGLILALAAAVFERLLALLDTVATDPFTAPNTLRLRQIGWLILAMQPVGFLVGWIGTHLPPDHDYGDGFGISVTSLLAALLSFVLAELFERGRAMRDDLEGTV
jgi:hypothetical protein